MLKKLLNTKDFQRSLLEDIISSQKILKSDLEFAKHKISRSIFEEKYNDCYTKKDEKTAKKIYNLFNILPADDLKTKSFNVKTIATIPVKFELPYDPKKPKFFKDNLQEIDILLLKYKPKTNRSFFAREIFSGVNFYKELIKGYTMQKGYKYTGQIPLEREVNILGDYISNDIHIPKNFNITSTPLK